MMEQLDGQISIDEWIADAFSNKAKDGSCNACKDIDKSIKKKYGGCMAYRCKRNGMTFWTNNEDYFDQYGCNNFEVEEQE